MASLGVIREVADDSPRTVSKGPILSLEYDQISKWRRSQGVEPSALELDKRSVAYNLRPRYGVLGFLGYRNPL